MSSFLVKNFDGSRGFYLVHKAVCIGIFNCGDPSVKNIWFLLYEVFVTVESADKILK